MVELGAVELDVVSLGRYARLKYSEGIKGRMEWDIIIYGVEVMVC